MKKLIFCCLFLPIKIEANTNIELIYYSADWCTPCNQTNSIYNDLKGQFSNVSNVVFQMIKIHGNSNKPPSINAIPTFVLKKNGEIKRRITGGQTTEAKLQNLINQYLN